MTMPTNIAPRLWKATGIGIENVVQPILLYMATFLCLKLSAHVHYAELPIEDLWSGSADRPDRSSWKQRQEINS